MGKFLIIPDWTTLLSFDHKNCVNRFVYLLTKEFFPNFKVTEKFSVHKFWQTLWVPYLWTNSPLLMDTTGCRGPWMSGTHHGLCPPSHAFCSCHILPSFFTQVMIIIHLFYCMYLSVWCQCVGVHMCVSMCIPVCSYMCRGPNLMSGVFFDCSFHSIARQGLSREPKACWFSQSR